MSKTIAIVSSDFVFKERTKILHKNIMLNGMGTIELMCFKVKCPTKTVILLINFRLAEYAC